MSTISITLKSGETTTRQAVYKAFDEAKIPWGPKGPKWMEKHAQEVKERREAMVMPVVLIALAVIVGAGITLAAHFQGTPFPTCLYIGLGSAAPFFIVSLLQLTGSGCALRMQKKSLNEQLNRGDVEQIFRDAQERHDGTDVANRIQV